MITPLACIGTLPRKIFFVGSLRNPDGKGTMSAGATPLVTISCGAGLLVLALHLEKLYVED